MNGSNITDGVNCIITEKKLVGDHEADMLHSVFMISTPILSTSIIITNLPVVLSSGLILKKGQQPKTTYAFLGNIAMADLIIGISIGALRIYPDMNSNRNICMAQMGILMAANITSAYSIGLIGVDRFLYILHGMQYQRWLYSKRARLLISMSWIIGLVIGFLPLMGWNEIHCPCWFIVITPKGLILLTVVAGAIPLIVVIILYFIILYRATKKVNQLQHLETTKNTIQNNPSSGNIRMFRGRSNPDSHNEGETGQQQHQGRGSIMKVKWNSPASESAPNKWKAIKVVVFTTGGFIITWFPFIITCIIYIFSCTINDYSQKCKTLRLLTVLYLPVMRLSNCILNPVIYAWWHNGFRRFVKKQIVHIHIQNSKFIFFRRRARPENSLTSNLRTDSYKNKSVHNTDYRNNGVYINESSLSTKI